MKVIAKSKREFEDIVRASKIIHDHLDFDLNENPILLRLAHLYRIKHAHFEGERGKAESRFLKKVFFVKKSKIG